MESRAATHAPGVIVGAALGALALAWYLVAPRRPARPAKESRRLYLATVNGVVRPPPGAR